MRDARTLATLSIALTLIVGLAPAHAGSMTVVVLNNLDQTPQPTASSPFVGQSFIAGEEQQLYGARMQLDPTSTPSAAIQLEVEARNADGTVGQTLFSNFTSTYDATTGIVTFLADSRFTLTTGTGYWLVLSDPTAGGVTWDFTASQIYQSNLAYGLPSYNTSYYSNQDNGQGNTTYYQPSDGPQMFQLLVVPEPSTPILLGIGIAIVTHAIGRRGRLA